MSKPRCASCGYSNMMKFDKRSNKYVCGRCWRQPYLTPAARKDGIKDLLSFFPKPGQKLR